LHQRSESLDWNYYIGKNLKSGKKVNKYEFSVKSNSGTRKFNVIHGDSKNIESVMLSIMCDYHGCSEVTFEDMTESLVYLMGENKEIQKFSLIK
jgi:hypothetical protein